MKTELTVLDGGMGKSLFVEVRHQVVCGRLKH